MRFAFLAFSLFIGHALAAQTNPDYDPDFDGNGCYTVLDILSFLVILMPDDAGMDSPNPDYDPDYDDNGELTVMDLTGMLTWFGECAATLLCESPTMDGHTYAVVTIGDQCWFAENLRTTTYADGASIPAGLDSAAWFNTTAGASAVYGEGMTDCVSVHPDFDGCEEALSLVEFGRLYNWYAVNDARHLCPGGWHVPAVEEWVALRDYVASEGFEGAEGGALKASSGWYSEPQNGFEETDGTDDFGFDGRPAGARTPLFLTEQVDEFTGAGSSAVFWSSTASGLNGGAFVCFFEWLSDNFGLENFQSAAGFSVRCLKDAE